MVESHIGEQHIVQSISLDESAPGSPVMPEANVASGSDTDEFLPRRCGNLFHKLFCPLRVRTFLCALSLPESTRVHRIRADQLGQSIWNAAGVDTNSIPATRPSMNTHAPT